MGLGQKRGNVKPRRDLSFHKQPTSTAMAVMVIRWDSKQQKESAYGRTT
jgi:hypothetical protein